MTTKKIIVSQEDYKEAAQEMVTFLQRQQEKLGEIIKGLSIATDFSPLTIEAMREATVEMKSTPAQLAKMVHISVQRGFSSFEEDRLRFQEGLNERKAKLLNGTLRVNRREEQDMAAE